jgi:hypothetical protein
MSNSDNEYWFVGGTSLNQYCWSINTFAAGRAVPVMRGNNIQVAYIPGQIYRQKYPDSRSLDFSMFVAAVDPATDQPPSQAQKLMFSNNVRTLQQLFYNYNSQMAGQQFPLTRQWYYSLPVNLGQPQGVPTMVQATAMAEIAGDLQLTMNGPHAASLTVTLLLADPYFYGPAITGAVTVNAGASTVVNTGDDMAAYFNNTVTLYGPLQYPRFLNSTTNPDTWFQLNTVILGGDSVTLDIANFTAYRASDGANLSGLLTRSGTTRWMSYYPGSNSVSLSSNNSGDTGTASFSFVPPYV